MTNLERDNRRQHKLTQQAPFTSGCRSWPEGHSYTPPNVAYQPADGFTNSYSMYVPAEGGYGPGGNAYGLTPDAHPAPKGMVYEQRRKHQPSRLLRRHNQDCDHDDEGPEDSSSGRLSRVTRSRSLPAEDGKRKSKSTWPAILRRR